MMALELGSNSDLVALVLDTGSGSLYTDGYNPATSETSKNMNIHPIFGYGSGAVEGEASKTWSSTCTCTNQRRLKTTTHKGL
jgi:hypothetical protein